MQHKWVKCAAFWVMAVVCLCGARDSRAAQTLLSEDFEGLTMKDATSPTETAAPGVWTDEAPAGWTRDNSTTPVGPPAEFLGWTFLNKDWWVQTAGDQQRSTFTGGQGTVAVADADEYDDGTNIDDALYNVFLASPSIDLSGVQANSVHVTFDSNFRAEPTQIALLEVSFDGAPYTNLLTYSSPPLGDGEQLNDLLDIAINNPSGGSMTLRWGLTEGSNDWWWAVDNINVTGELVPEPSSLLLASLMGLGLISAGRRRG